MPKTRFEDIKKINSTRRTSVQQPTTPETVPEPKIVHPTESRPSPRKPSRPIRTPLALILILAIIGGVGYGAGNFFERTTVGIENKTQSFALDHKQFTASKTSSSLVPFEIMIVSDTAGIPMALTESQTVSTKAQGTITLYNEYSAKPQTISVNSYVSDSSGKTYKTDKVVTIPGFTSVKGAVVPGKVAVGITAFLPGSSYNVAPGDFTINAYKGTAKFTKIYGKATTPITGGAEGLVYKLTPQEKGKIDAIATTSFKTNVYKKAYAQVPSGYIAYPNAVQFSYRVDSDSMYKDQNATVNISGTATAFLLKEKDVSDAIKRTLLPDISKTEFEEVQIPDISKLSFDFADPKELITKDMQSAVFTFTGPLDAVWHPDVEALRARLAGISKDSVAAIFKQDNGIANAHVRVFPPWHGNLPVEPARIHITVK